MKKVKLHLRHWYMLLWLRYYYALGPKQKLRLTLREFHPYFYADPELMGIDGNDGEYCSLVNSLKMYLHDQEDIGNMLKILHHRKKMTDPSFIDTVMAFLGAILPSDILALKSKVPEVYSDVD